MQAAQTLYTRIQATDPETARQAIDSFHEAIGGTEVEAIDMRGSASGGKSRQSTAFSSMGWKATWQPTGPTHPWGKPKEN